MEVTKKYLSPFHIIPNMQKKKISILISEDIIRQIEDAGLTQTEAVTKALDILFSEDYQMISEYKNQILEDEKKILILEARVDESDKFRSMLEDQNKMNQAHISQVQTLITQMENERRSREDIIRKKEEKILLLEDGKKKKWWKIWQA